MLQNCIDTVSFLKNTISTVIFKIKKFKVSFILSIATIYFKGRNFRGKKVSQFSLTAKFSYFAGINFRGQIISTYFAVIIFRRISEKETILLLLSIEICIFQLISIKFAYMIYFAGMSFRG